MIDCSIFTTRRYASAVYGVVLSLSVNHMPELSKWFNLGSRKQRHMIDRDSNFPTPKIMAKFEQSPLTGTSNAGGEG